MKAKFLSRFTPSFMEHKVLEAIFVQREELAARLVEVTRESALTPSKHHTLLIGPRGIGKTHLVALVYHRVQKMEDLRDRLIIAWLREEEWGVTSFLDLLLRVFRALLEEEEYYDAGIAERIESLYDLPPDAAERSAAQLLKEFAGDRTLLILMENLEDLFDGLGDEGQKRLRAYLQENPFCTILATAQSLFGGVSLQISPFYGFFRVHHLEELDLEGATALLTNIADFEADSDLASFIRTPAGRARIRAVHHLAGGNHRVYVIFSQFITRESLDELVESVMRTLDDLTPYYQARMRWLSPQQRKIVEFLCDRRGAVPVKEIAGRSFMTHQTASGQLKSLREMVYVSSVSVGRESYYELREPLMRLCAQVKKQRGDPIRLLVDFLRLWHSREELERRLASLRPDATLEREYVFHALQAIEEEIEDPHVVACLKDSQAYFEAGDFTHALEVVEELVALHGRAQDWARRGCYLEDLGRYDEALDSCGKAIEIDPDHPRAWCCRGKVLGNLRRYDEAIVSFDKAVELDPDYEPAWYHRGMTLGGLERYDEALVSLDKAIELAPDYILAWYGRGMALYDLERYDEALVSLDKAVELDSDYTLAWHHRGVVLNNLERYDEALASVDRVVELDPDAPAWFGRGMVLHNLKRDDEALVSLDKAIELDSGDALVWLLQGEILQQLGRYDEALTSFSKAIDMGAKILCPFFYRVECLLALNRWDEGDTALDDALQRFVHDVEHIAGHTKAVIRDLFTGTIDAVTWRMRITTLIELYDKHQVLSALGQGLVRSISELKSPMISDAAARMWLEVWRELAGDRDEFQIPLRLLDAAVRYRETKDQRVLLRLPIEERKLLEPLLEGPDA